MLLIATVTFIFKEKSKMSPEGPNHEYSKKKKIYE